MASAPPDPHPDSPPSDPAEHPDQLTPADEPARQAPDVIPADDMLRSPLGPVRIDKTWKIVPRRRPGSS